jgi:hypothetical protein
MAGKQNTAKLKNPKAATHSPALCNKPRPKAYTYPTQLIALTVGLWLSSGCSYRAVVKVLCYLQLEWGFLGPVPSKTTINIWTEKLGYYQYTHPVASPDQDYALIVDECMVIGQERLLVVLSIQATKDQPQATTFAQVRLVSLSVRGSWCAVDIERVLAHVQVKLGRKALYIISDGCANLVRGIADSGFVRICDVGHELALLVGRHYGKDAAFMAWTTAMSQCRYKGIMRPEAYLLPPKQRTIARFMNLSSCVLWSERMLACLKALNPAESAAFSWLSDHRVLIEELGLVFGVLDTMCTYLKVNGLSHSSVSHCLGLLKPIGGPKLDSLCVALWAYLVKEQAKLPNSVCVWHCCSSILESVFGHFKSVLATNPLCGVRASVLSLGLQVDVGLGFDIGLALESVSMADLAQWKLDNLSESQVVKRRKVLKI